MKHNGAPSDLLIDLSYEGKFMLNLGYRENLYIINFNKGELKFNTSEKLKITFDKTMSGEEYQLMGL